jgi:hypothetical protein
LVKVQVATLAAFIVSSPASAMSFDFVSLSINNCTTQCPKVIVATGEIYLGDAETFVEKLRSAIRREPDLRPVVLLHSTGGNMGAALQLGEVFRSIKATVVVAQARSNGSVYAPTGGGCASACVFSLMGGVKRVVPDDSRVAIHWVSAPTPQGYLGNVVQPDASMKSDDQNTEALMRKYMRGMGVRAEFAAFIRKVPNSSFHVMTPQEVTRFGLARRTFQ